MKTCTIFIILFLLLPASPSYAGAEGKIYRVAGTSMIPTLLPGDPVMVADVKGLERGDLVAIGFQRAAHPMVKRVIAVAGDRVAITGGVLLVNDEKMRKIDSALWTVPMKQLSHYGGRLPAGTLLVLGDNPGNSRDSRRFGLISVYQIVGKVLPLREDARKKQGTERSSKGVHGTTF